MVSPNICEKSCQKFVTISMTSRSILLSFCQIFMTITTDLKDSETVIIVTETVITVTEKYFSKIHTS